MVVITLHPVLAAMFALQQPSDEVSEPGADPAGLIAPSLRQLNVSRPDRGYWLTAKRGWRTFQRDELSA